MACMGDKRSPERGFGLRLLQIVPEADREGAYRPNGTSRISPSSPEGCGRTLSMSWGSNLVP
jgi:hypothetical protein